MKSIQRSLAALVAGLLASFTVKSLAIDQLAPGTVAPDFTMQDMAGEDVKLSDYAGKIIVLDFWATWCGPCIESFPHVQEIAAKYKDQGVVVIAAGTSDTVARFKAWIPAHAGQFPDLVFAFDRNGRGIPAYDQRASTRLYGVSGLPTKFVIGRDGRIAAVVVGSGISGMPRPDARTEVALAALGVKIDAAVIDLGRRQIAKFEEYQADYKARESAAAAAEAAHPRPPFQTGLGRLKAGEILPDFTALRPDGTPVKFSDLARGKTVVVSFRPGASERLALHETWASKYAGHGVVFLGVFTYTSRENFDLWRAENVGRYSFPVVFDPAGEFADERDPDKLSAAEKQDYEAAYAAYRGRLIPVQLTGALEGLGSSFVVDAQGRLVGNYPYKEVRQIPEALGNLLLRAGIKLATEDLPKKVWTAEESKAAERETASR